MRFKGYTLKEEKDSEAREKVMLIGAKGCAQEEGQFRKPE